MAMNRCHHSDYSGTQPKIGLLILVNIGVLQWC
jgi:hypothetical protein